MTSAGHDTMPLEFSVRGQRVAGLFRSPRGTPGAQVPGIVTPHAVAGVLEMAVVAHLAWGRPATKT